MRRMPKSVNSAFANEFGIESTNELDRCAMLLFDKICL